MSGGGSSGKLDLGTYQVDFLDAQGNLITDLALAHPFTFRYHLPQAQQSWLWQDQKIDAIWQPFCICSIRSESCSENSNIACSRLPTAPGGTERSNVTGVEREYEFKCSIVNTCDKHETCGNGQSNTNTIGSHANGNNQSNCDASGKCYTNANNHYTINVVGSHANSNDQSNCDTIGRYHTDANNQSNTDANGKCHADTRSITGSSGGVCEQFNRIQHRSTDRQLGQDKGCGCRSEFGFAHQ